MQVLSAFIVLTWDRTWLLTMQRDWHIQSIHYEIL